MACGARGLAFVYFVSRAIRRQFCCIGIVCVCKMQYDIPRGAFWLGLAREASKHVGIDRSRRFFGI